MAFKGTLGDTPLYTRSSAWRTVGGRWADGWHALTSRVRELRHARRTCRALLELHGLICREQPGLAPYARYGEVVARHLGMESAAAGDVLALAAESCAEWPSPRPLRLRDVIHYLTARDCLAARPHAIGLHIDLPALVARVVPADL